jgi:hypothetical protein
VQNQPLAKSRQKVGRVGDAAGKSISDRVTSTKRS